MKKKIFIFCCFCLLSIITIYFVYIYLYFSKSDIIPYPNIVYKFEEDNYTSCISLMNNYIFVENNCYNKKSNMIFNNNYCSRYSYDLDNQTITFYCYKKRINSKIVASILKWNDKELKIKYKDFNERLNINTYFAIE